MTNESSTKGGEGTDHLDPYHLHYSDHPGNILVTKSLNGDNYGTWSHSIGIALSTKNNSGFVDGLIKRSSESDSKFPIWKRCNDMFLSWILNPGDPNLVNNVIYVDSAIEVCSNIEQ
uniref:Retrotransposon Copia-like N-terminal domain-containing protein n=1 Tax=Davidia involucrata TaxID=16924 RepID=A0A5B7BIE2_DAVIN